jgi:hypothetical protein
MADDADDDTIWQRRFQFDQCAPNERSGHITIGSPSPKAGQIAVGGNLIFPELCTCYWGCLNTEGSMGVGSCQSPTPWSRA